MPRHLTAPCCGVRSWQSCGEVVFEWHSQLQHIFMQTVDMMLTGKGGVSQQTGAAVQHYSRGNRDLTRSDMLLFFFLVLLKHSILLKDCVGQLC